jgi:Flp pilus assembly pilin Flp
MNLLLTLLARLTSERGQTMAEYGVLIAWIALLVIVGVNTLGHSLTSIFSSTAGKV